MSVYHVTGRIIAAAIGLSKNSGQSVKVKRESRSLKAVQRELLTYANLTAFVSLVESYLHQTIVCISNQKNILLPFAQYNLVYTTVTTVKTLLQRNPSPVQKFAVFLYFRKSFDHPCAMCRISMSFAFVLF